jgi:hypothetical protein
MIMGRLEVVGETLGDLGIKTAQGIDGARNRRLPAFENLGKAGPLPGLEISRVAGDADVADSLVETGQSRCGDVKKCRRRRKRVIVRPRLIKRLEPGPAVFRQVAEGDDAAGVGR